MRQIKIIIDEGNFTASGVDDAEAEEITKKMKDKKKTFNHTFASGPHNGTEVIIKKERINFFESYYQQPIEPEEAPGSLWDKLTN